MSAPKKPRRKPPPEKPVRRSSSWRAVLAAVGAFAIAVIVARALLAPKDTRPWNLVLVSIDTLRADQLSIYGGDVPAPHIARLAREGVLFENAQSVAPLTLPAHASLFTAQWPTSHGVRDNVGFYLREGAATLASHLGEQGYRTGGFVSAFVLDSRFGIDQGFEHYADDFDGGSEEVAAGFVSQIPGAEVVSRAREWIANAAPEPSPFFAFVHLFEPHTPYEPPPGYAQGSDAVSRYRGEVAYADALVGELLSSLEVRGLGENTVIVVTSDHGESLGDHGELTHGLFLYESTLRIPLVVRYPGAPRGARVRGLARLVDVVPTLLELMALPPLPGADGSSLAALIDAPDSETERSAYAESYFARLHYGWSELRSLRDGRHKLVLAPTPELYDLDTDPEESSNRFDADPQTAQRLMQELSKMAVDEVPVAGPLDSESRARLEALGYVGGGVGGVPVDESVPRADPKDRLDVYHALNDPALASVEPADGAAFREALSRLARAVREKPAIPQAFILYGELLLKAGNAGEAERVFSELVAIDASFESFYGLGLARQRAGESAASEEAFLEAHALEPRNTKSHFRLSELAAARGDLDAAERWLRDAIAVSPNHMLRGKLATLYLRAGRTQEARDVLDTIASADGRDPVAIYNMGQTLLVDGDPAGALEMFRFAAELDPDDEDIHHGIGTALLSAGDPAAALEAYARALELAPCFAGAHANRGLAYLQLGRESEGVESLKRAVSCEPRYAPGYRNLAAAQLQMGDVSGAIETLTRAQQQFPDDAEIRRELAELTRYRDQQR